MNSKKKRLDATLSELGCVCMIREIIAVGPRAHAILNSWISPISLFRSPPTLYDTFHRSLIDSTFVSLLSECQMSIDWVTPRLCFGSNVLPDCGLSRLS